jgi:DNA (cytosine-5)-methyltransferase 1
LTGGIDLAAEWAGFRTIGQCEYADYPTKVLEKHWPDVERWKDVRDVTRYSIRQRGIDPAGITLLSGGFPCQPHSVAGKRKASLDERDLWGEFARVICETHPRWVLGENVAGLLSSENGRFFGRVLRDLAEVGYRVGWACYGACDVGELHERERVAIIANANRKRLSRRQEIAQVAKSLQQLPRFLPADIGTKISEYRANRGSDGVSDRVDRLRCLGNAVDPYWIYPFLQAIADYETGGDRA